MKKKVFIASNNQGKIERFKKLFLDTGLDLGILTPGELGLENIDIEENGMTLLENAEIKARAYFGMVEMPILANDAGFWVEGEGLVDAPKRIALGETGEKTLTKEMVADALLKFWKGVAKRHGGQVEAAWVEAFVLLKPDGRLQVAESKREVILTDQEFGNAHLQLPVRALYISKATNKPAIQHTQEEESIELKPVADALHRILSD